MTRADMVAADKVYQDTVSAAAKAYGLVMREAFLNTDDNDSYAQAVAPAMAEYDRVLTEARKAYSITTGTPWPLEP